MNRIEKKVYAIQRKSGAHRVTFSHIDGGAQAGQWFVFVSFDGTTKQCLSQNPNLSWALDSALARLDGAIVQHHFKTSAAEAAKSVSDLGRAAGGEGDA